MHAVTDRQRKRILLPTGWLILSLALASCARAAGAAPAVATLTPSAMPTQVARTVTRAMATPAAHTLAPSAMPTRVARTVTRAVATPTSSLAAPVLPTETFTPPPTPTVAPSPMAETWETETISAIDAVAQRLVSSVPLAGLTLGVRQGARPVYLQGYGWADMGAGVPAQTDTIYEIASLSKQFTAAAILQLAEQGKLDLEAPAVQYLPDLPAAAQTITVRQLLHHTSGLPPNNFLFAVLSRLQPYSPGEVLATYNQSLTSLSFDPGTAWEYSNMGYFVLGAIVENVSGMSYGDYLAKHVVAAAGLTDTSYCLEPPPNLARGYAVGGANWELALLDNLSLESGAAGVCSTAGDLIAWQQALAAGRVVAPASYQAMITPVTLLDGSQVPYGYGLKVGDYGGQSAIYHQGLMPGFGSVLAYYPGDDIAIVLLTNTQADTGQLDSAVRKIRDILSARP